MDKLTGTDLQKNINSIQKNTNHTGIEGNIALLGTALAKAFQFITRTGKSKNNTPNLRGTSINNTSKNILSDEIMDIINPQKLKNIKNAKKKRSTPKSNKEEIEIKDKELTETIKKRAKQAVKSITKSQNKKKVKLKRKVNKIKNRIREL